MRGLAMLLGAIVVAPLGAGAQRADRLSVSVVAGSGEYDLGGTGTGTSFNGAVTWRPLNRVLVVESNVGLFRTTPEPGVRSTLLLPELGVQAEVRLGRVRPFIGGGVGQARESVQGYTSDWETTLHGVLGARLALGAGWGVRLEGRVRAVDPFAGTVADFGVGLQRRVL